MVIGCFLEGFWGSESKISGKRLWYACITHKILNECLGFARWLLSTSSLLLWCVKIWSSYHFKISLYYTTTVTEFAYSLLLVLKLLPRVPFLPFQCQIGKLFPVSYLDCFSLLPKYDSFWGLCEFLLKRNSSEHDLWMCISKLFLAVWFGDFVIYFIIRSWEIVDKKVFPGLNR